MHIFISYAKVDTRLLALKIRDTLRSIPGLTAWMDESIESGEDWALQIQDEIDRSELMLVLLSPDVNRTTTPRSFVLREIHYAQDNNKAILPVLAQKTKIPVQLAGIQYADLTTNEAVGIEALVEDICQRVGVTSPAELKRQAEESERQRIAEMHRQAVEAEQKKQAQLAAQRQADEEERRRVAQIEAQRQADEQRQRQQQIDAQRHAEEQQRRQAQQPPPLLVQQNMQATQPTPIPQRPNAPQQWDKQYSDGSAAVYQAKVNAAGAPKRASNLPLLAGGAVIGVVLLAVIVGVLLSGVLGKDDDENGGGNDGLGTYQMSFTSGQLINFVDSEGTRHDVCSYRNISLGSDDVGHKLNIEAESWEGSRPELVSAFLLLSKIGPFKNGWDVGETDIELFEDSSWTIGQAGDYVLCLTVGWNDYTANKVDDFSASIRIWVSEN